MRVAMRNQTIYLALVLGITLVLALGCGRANAPRTTLPEKTRPLDFLKSSWIQACHSTTLGTQAITLYGFSSAEFTQTEFHYEDAECKSKPLYTVKVKGRFSLADGELPPHLIEFLVSSVELAPNSQTVVDEANGVRLANAVWSVGKFVNVSGFETLPADDSARYLSKFETGYAHFSFSEDKENLNIGKWSDATGIDTNLIKAEKVNEPSLDQVFSRQ